LQIVQPVPLAFTKTTTIKATVANATLKNRTSMQKQHVVVVTLVGWAAVTVIVQLARLDSIKIPKEKKSAGIHVMC
jgi:hypothetical protein